MKLRYTAPENSALQHPGTFQITILKNLRHTLLFTCELLSFDTPDSVLLLKSRKLILTVRHKICNDGTNWALEHFRSYCILSG